MKNRKAKLVNSNDYNQRSSTFTLENLNNNFDHFFRMFKNCKENLVSLNKKFDVLENYFKNYILSSKQSKINENQSIVTDEVGDKHKISSDRHDRPKRNLRRIKNDNHNDKFLHHNEEKNEGDLFPISNEDLEFLTQDYISGQREAENNLSTIPKQKLRKKSNDSSFKNKSKISIEEERDNKDLVKEFDFKITKQNEHKSENLSENAVAFNEKLFNYKNFTNLNNSNNIKQTNVSSPQKNDAISYKDINKNAEESQWITKQTENKAYDINDINNDYLLSNNINEINHIDDDISLSIEDAPIITTKKRNNKLNNDNLDISNEKKLTRYSEFIKIKRERLNENPNLFKKNLQVENKSVDELKYDLDIQSVEDNSNDFYNLRTRGTVKKQIKNVKKERGNKCKKCIKAINLTENEQPQQDDNICKKCYLQMQIGKELEYTP